jgi:uncharacterized protein YgiM (DUF1202 family)
MPLRFVPVFFTWGLILLALVSFAGCRGARVPSDSSIHPPSQKDEGEKVKSAPPAVTGQREPASVDDGKNTLSVTADRLNLRACPGTHCRVLIILRRADLLILTEWRGEWMRVRVKDSGREGWVSSRHVCRESTQREPSPHPVGEAPAFKEEWADPKKSAGPSQPIKEEYTK